MNTKKLFLYLHTLMHLKPKQIFYRVKKGKSCFKKPLKQNSENEKIIFPRTVFYTPKVNQIVFNNKFTLLNETKEVDLFSWDVSASHLWSYNLHYFDYIHDLDNHLSIEYMLSWIKANNDFTKVSWEAYPISLRLVNWLKFISNNDIVIKEIEESIFVHAKVLLQRIEYHLLGNHLFSNAKALIFAGCYIEGPTGEEALRTGLKILSTELKEQFLSDGAHFELSPMYNNIMLFDLLDIYNVLTSKVKDIEKNIINDLSNVIKLSYCWAEYMSHNDGDIAYFNDSTSGLCPSIFEINNYALELGFDISTHINEGCYAKLMPKSKYYVEKQSKYKLFADFASIGPDYLPGHAHADNLSFELDVYDHRFIVNSGISEYGTGIERERQRSTSSHSTVVVNNQSSSEMWAGFRVARRAKTHIDNILLANDKNVIEGHHNGYRLLKKNIIHSRKFETNDNFIHIFDSVNEKTYPKYAVFHLHPDVSILNIYDNQLILDCNGCIVTMKFVFLDKIEVKNSSFHPGFGLSVDNMKIIVHFKDSLETIIEIH